MKKQSAVTLSIFSGLLVVGALTPQFLEKNRMENGRSPATQDQKENEENAPSVEEKKDDIVCDKKSSEDLEKKMQKLLDDKIAVLYEEEEYRNYKVEQRKTEKRKEQERKKKKKQDENTLEEVALSQPSSDPNLMLIIQQMASMTSMMSTMINSQQKMMEQMFSMLGPPSIQSFNRQPSLFDDSYALSTLLLSQRIGTGLQNPYGTPSPYYERMPAQINYRETLNPGPYFPDGYNMSPGPSRDFSRGFIVN